MSSFYNVSSPIPPNPSLIFGAIVISYIVLKRRK